MTVSSSNAIKLLLYGVRKKEEECCDELQAIKGLFVSESLNASCLSLL